LLSGVDLLPTLLEAFGVPVPANVQGRSFLDALEGGPYVGREAVFTEQSYNAWTDVSRAVGTQRHRLIVNFTPGRGFSDSSQTWRPRTRVRFLENATRTYQPPFELYDLAEDPLEERSLAGQPGHEVVFRDLRRRMLHWMRETEDPGSRVSRCRPSIAGRRRG
jgi:arylsulfatase A-like enzyme